MYPNGYQYGRYYYNPSCSTSSASFNQQPQVVYSNVVNFTVAPDGTHYFHQTFNGNFTVPDTAITAPFVPPTHLPLETKSKTSRRRKPKESHPPTKETASEEEKEEGRDKTEHKEEVAEKADDSWADDDSVSDWGDTQSEDPSGSTDYSWDEDDELWCGQTSADSAAGDYNIRPYRECSPQERRNRHPRSSIVSMFPLPNMNIFGAPPGPF